ncbi:MAG: IclR family transcriptional regulator [Gaiellaceae bacterium]
MTSTPGTQSIDRAAQLLVHVLESPQPPTIGSLAIAGELPKSTTSRLVRALERQGLVERDGARGSIRPGPVIVRFARGSARNADLVAVATDTLRSLAERSGETVNLAVPGRAGVDHLAQRDSRHFIGGTNWVGRAAPFHCTANGKVLLAFGAARLPAGPLERLTPQTIVEPATLELELATVRARGYATTLEELEPGLAAVAAPLFDPGSGEAVAALSVSGPTIRLTPARLDEFGALLIDHAAGLSARLDHHDAKRGAA